MAVTLAPIPRYQYLGLSSDTKPTGMGVGVNDLFFETDTGLFFIYSGSGWSAYVLGGGPGSGTAAGTSFNPAGTGMSSTNVQTAIAELKTLIDAINAVLS